MMAKDTTGRLDVTVKTGGKRKLSSKLWLERQLKDPYVGQARRGGVGSRGGHKMSGDGHKDYFLKHGIPLGRPCAQSRRNACRKSVSERCGRRTAGTVEARFCQRAACEAGLEPAGFLRTLCAGHGVSGEAEGASLRPNRHCEERQRRSNPDFVIPGWCVSTRPGISRFRVRCFASPRNDEKVLSITTADRARLRWFRWRPWRRLSPRPCGWKSRPPCGRRFRGRHRQAF